MKVTKNHEIKLILYEIKLVYRYIFKFTNKEYKKVEEFSD